MFAISTGGLAALATAVAVFAGVGSCAPTPAPPVPGVTTDGATPPDSTDTPPTAGPPTSGPPSQNRAGVYVYYLGPDGTRVRLYRELHSIPAGDGSGAAKTRAGLAEMFDGGTARDPDYSTGWPASARVRDVRILGQVVVVDLTGVAQNSVGTEVANQAVQQLIWTATANTGLDLVRILVDGRPVSELWGAVAVGGDLRRGDSTQVLGAVWLISPQEGDSVNRTFEIHVSGTTFESNVVIRARQGGTTVQQTHVTVSPGQPARGEARTTLTLPPGTYQLEAFEFSAEDGSVIHLDGHQITVR